MLESIRTSLGLTITEVVTVPKLRHSRRPFYTLHQTGLSQTSRELRCPIGCPNVCDRINFLCKARQVTEYDMVVIAQDRLAHDFFTSLGIETLDSSDFGLPDAASESTAWGDPAYDALIRARLVMLLQILEMGFNAFFSDVDIAWNGDPVMGLLEGVSITSQVRRNLDRRTAGMREMEDKISSSCTF